MSGLVRERLPEGIEVLRLDRPDVRNALDTATTTELAGALEALGPDEGTAVVVLSTTSAAFCAGADVAEELTPEEGVVRMEQFARLYAALEAMGQPVICVCVGDVVGAGPRSRWAPTCALPTTACGCAGWVACWACR